MKKLFLIFAASAAFWSCTQDNPYEITPPRKMMRRRLRVC